MIHQQHMCWSTKRRSAALKHRSNKTAARDVDFAMMHAQLRPCKSAPSAKAFHTSSAFKQSSNLLLSVRLVDSEELQKSSRPRSGSSKRTRAGRMLEALLSLSTNPQRPKLQQVRHVPSCRAEQVHSLCQFNSSQCAPGTNTSISAPCEYHLSNRRAVYIP